MIYCDTSYLVRLYQDEPGADLVRELCSKNEIATSMHSKAELPAALHRCWREGRIRMDSFPVLMAQFEAEVAAGAIHWLSLSNSLLDGMIHRFRRIPVAVFLRAADALHLACASEHGFKEVYSNDRHFLSAAPHFGLRGMNIIPAQQKRSQEPSRKRGKR